MNKIRIFYLLLFIIAIVVLLFPTGEQFWLPCPLYQWTGWQCPFCGGQRMMQALLHGEFIKAFNHNPLLLCALPILLLGGFRLLFPQMAERYPCATGKGFFTDKALLLYLIICFLWGIARNLKLII